MATTLRHWLGAQKYQLGQTLRGLAYRTGTPWGQQVVSNFWEEQAAPIHEQWGHDEHDFHVLSKLFRQYQPKSLLDVGCGVCIANMGSTKLSALILPKRHCGWPKSAFLG